MRKRLPLIFLSLGLALAVTAGLCQPGLDPGLRLLGDGIAV